VVKYKVLAYQGVVWLKDCGVFDDFYEAQDRMELEHEKYCANSESDEDCKINSEAFLFVSRIEEVVTSE
jgi:hypothetical protein